jgi:Lrp/AsnC family leucine-responsive transcriptional regulator
MNNDALDDLDRCILYELQQDARDTSSSDIAKRIDVSSSTVRNRIHRLEDRGIIRGYHLDIDYERAGFPLYTKLICTAPINQREELARQTLSVRGVVAVREVMTGNQNIYINVIATDHDDLSRITREINDLGVEVSDERIIRDEYICPYSGFQLSDEHD